MEVPKAENGGEKMKSLSHQYPGSCAVEFQFQLAHLNLNSYQSCASKTELLNPLEILDRLP